jgi:RNA polymerase sigma-70 factor (ECF subfamily)
LQYYIRRLIRQEQDAVNVLQEVWMQAFRGIRSLQQEQRFAPWLYTIARRTALNHFRSDYRRREEFVPDVTDNAIDDDDEQLRFENAELVHYGLVQLGANECEVLTLYFLQDLTVSEIGNVIGVPTGTVKSRLYKARQDLRRILAKEAQRHDK